MDVIGAIRKKPANRTRQDIRSRPMYGRKGVTVGQHLDEFDTFEDDNGRSFDELVHLLLFDEEKKRTGASIKSQGAPAPVKSQVEPAPAGTQVAPKPVQQQAVPKVCRVENPGLPAGRFASKEEQDYAAMEFLRRVEYRHLETIRRQMITAPVTERDHEKQAVKVAKKSTKQEDPTADVRLGSDFNPNRRKRPNTKRYFKPS